ncbi:MAG: hypothetical protein CME64_10110 [Halobacteriovoraceae bacterium]|nr:hypothetical protein [Halobacteriovoraceae bacterium]|tara:strand:+ start:108762 stop:109319 length:558 start_codon:yes stop_codon:yes gene_type:complete
MKTTTFILLFLSLSLQANAKQNGNRWNIIKAACESKSEGQKCSFEMKGKKLEGECKKGKRDDSLLVCKRSGGGKMAILRELDLTDDQLKSLKEFMSSHSKKRKDLKGEGKAKREKMKQLFIAGKSDGELKKLHEEISLEHQKRGNLRLEKMIFLKNLLTKEQREAYIEKGGDRPKRRGRRGHGPK